MKDFIGSETIKGVKEMIDELLENNAYGMNEAMGKADSGKITASISLGFECKADGLCEVECSISYTLEKVKQTLKKRVFERQLDLFSKSGKETVNA